MHRHSEWSVIFMSAAQAREKHVASAFCGFAPATSLLAEPHGSRALNATTPNADGQNQQMRTEAPEFARAAQGLQNAEETGANMYVY